MELKVEKRDKSLEDYNPGKITKVLVAAVLEKNQAKEISDRVTKWLKEKNIQQVSSSDIRKKIIEILKEVDSQAHDFYVWYKKLEDKNHNGDS